MANQILAGAVVSASAVIAGVDADNPPVTDSGSSTDNTSPAFPHAGSFVDNFSGLQKNTSSLSLANGYNYASVHEWVRYGESHPSTNTDPRIAYIRQDDDGYVYALFTVNNAQPHPDGSTSYTGTHGYFGFGVWNAGNRVFNLYHSRSITEVDPVGSYFQVLTKTKVPYPLGLENFPAVWNEDVQGWVHTDWSAPSPNWVVVASRLDDDNGSNSGSVYVYDASDLSAQPTKLTAFDAAENDYFGNSVAATSDKIVVGAWGDDDNGSNSGAAYVFDISDLSAQPTKLTAYDGAASDQFGQFVAASDDKIVIASAYDDDNGTNSGSVYVYDANDLSAQPTKLTAFDAAENDRFGISVATTADKIVVGAYLDDDNETNSGSVYVYDANDLSAQPTKLTAFDGSDNDKFGETVSVTDDKIVVGAWRDNNNAGSVYVYNANDLSATPTKLTAFDGTAEDRFGISIAVSDDQIVVGAQYDGDNGFRSGSVYVYDANDLSVQPTKLTAFDGAEDDRFGISVAIV
jgi:hypothetical protein